MPSALELRNINTMLACIEIHMLADHQWSVDPTLRSTVRKVSLCVVAKIPVQIQEVQYFALSVCTTLCEWAYFKLNFQQVRAFINQTHPSVPTILQLFLFMSLTSLRNRPCQQRGWLFWEGESCSTHSQQHHYSSQLRSHACISIGLVNLCSFI